MVVHADTFEAVTDLAGQFARCETGAQLAALLPEVSEVFRHLSTAAQIALLGDAFALARTESVPSHPPAVSPARQLLAARGVNRG